VSKTDTFGTKVEVKNLNSFKSVEGAIEYEINRQIEVLESGGELTQETRGWDENKARTFSQRSKETAKDYRYFPDPDITKINTQEIPEFTAASLDEKLPILPSKKRLLYSNLGLASDTIEVIIFNGEIDKYFSQLLAALGDKTEVVVTAANYLTSDVIAIISSDEVSLNDLKIEHFSELIDMVHANKIGSRVAKDILPQLFASEVSPNEIATKQGLLQVSDSASLQPVIDQIIADNTEVVEQYRAGKEASIQFLVGQGMKATKGAANPALLKEMFAASIK